MSIQSTIQNFHPAGKFLLLIGLFLVALVIAGIIQVVILIPFADIKSINDLANLEDVSNPKLITGMKIAQAVSVLFTFILPAFLFAHFTSEKKTGYLQMNKGFPLMIGITVILLVFSVMPAINWAGELNSHMKLPEFMAGIEAWMKSSEEKLKKLTEAFLQMDSAVDLIVNVIVVALLAAVGEELFFRGCMQNVFLEWTKNKHAAVWVTAILFSALHAQFYGFLPRMLLGVVLGYLYIWSGSLWLSMLFHFLNNGMAVVFAYLIGKNMLQEEAENIGAGQTPLYFIFGSAIVSVGLLMFVYRNRNPEQPQP
ncbi:MAG: CPBP family intramembrane metalloprotease [Bacteroidetes bacterium]|nr:CPBP family intramembrane metalloprotease [Bacteroidota bacterium]